MAPTSVYTSGSFHIHLVPEPNLSLWGHTSSQPAKHCYHLNKLNIKYSKANQSKKLTLPLHVYVYLPALMGKATKNAGVISKEKPL